MFPCHPSELLSFQCKTLLLLISISSDLVFTSIGWLTFLVAMDLVQNVQIRCLVRPNCRWRDHRRVVVPGTKWFLCTKTIDPIPTGRNSNSPAAAMCLGEKMSWWSPYSRGKFATNCLDRWAFSMHPPHLTMLPIQPTRKWPKLLST